MTPEEKYNSQVDFDGSRVEVLPLFDKAVPGFANKIPVLFQLITGRDPAPSREAFSLAVVLDVSGSMQGTRLTSCKTAITQLIESADDGDRLSLVAYNDQVTTVFENIRCGDAGARKMMKEKLDALRADGITNLYGGLLAGYDLLHGNAEASNKHIFLLSDGQVNAGPLQQTNAILEAVADWEEKVPILSYGIGEGFNEKLMSPLGQVHRGSHYFYLTDAASIERLIARGIRALTGAVARNVCLNVTPLTSGLFFPDHMLDGARFPLVRERSVIQYLVELEVRPELPSRPDHSEVFKPSARAARDPDAATLSSAWEVVGAPDPGAARLSFAWEVEGFPLLAQSSGRVHFSVTTDRSFRKQESPEVRTYLDVKRGCELRRTAAGSQEARANCKQALQLFQGRLEHDRFGFAAEWAAKTKALLEDASLWAADGQVSAVGAKHLGVAYTGAGQQVEEEEEEEMDFDLFG